MRDMRKGTCPLCEHNQILEVVPAQFGDQNKEVPCAATYDSRWVLEGRNPNYPHGRFRLYVCRRCGFCQWFVDQPATIPVDADHKTRIIEGPESGAPYR